MSTTPSSEPSDRPSEEEPPPAGPEPASGSSSPPPGSAPRRPGPIRRPGRATRRPGPIRRPGPATPRRHLRPTRRPAIRPGPATRRRRLRPTHRHLRAPATHRRRLPATRRRLRATHHPQASGSAPPPTGGYQPGPNRLPTTPGLRLPATPRLRLPATPRLRLPAITLFVAAIRRQVVARQWRGRNPGRMVAASGGHHRRWHPPWRRKRHYPRRDGIQPGHWLLSRSRAAGCLPDPHDRRSWRPDRRQYGGQHRDDRWAHRSDPGLRPGGSRALVQIVLAFTIIGGFLDVLWPLWDRQNQTLHDKAAGTVVLRTDTNR